MLRASFLGSKQDGANVAATRYLAVVQSVRYALCDRFVASADSIMYGVFEADSGVSIAGAPKAGK